MKLIIPIQIFVDSGNSSKIQYGKFSTGDEHEDDFDFEQSNSKSINSIFPKSKTIVDSEKESIISGAEKIISPHLIIHSKKPTKKNEVLGNFYLLF